MRQPRGRMHKHRRSSERATCHIQLGGTQNFIWLARFFKVAIPLPRYLPQIRKMAAYMLAINTTGTFREALKTKIAGAHMTTWMVPPTHLDLSHRSPLVEQVC